MKAHKTLFIVAASLFLHGVTYGWGVTGHRVVGEIAQRHLSKKASRGIQELIGRETLAYWSNWPDFIKSDTTHKWDGTSAWHYVDLPGNMEKEAFIDSLEQLPGENLYTQIPAMIAQLKDRSLSVESRRNALAFLVHFMGDLHQPLHVGREEDQGGNKIPVYWFDKKMNLHSLWDVALIDFQQYSYTEYARMLDRRDKAMVLAFQQSSMDDWFYESHVISDKIYALTPAESKLSYRYNFLFQSTLDEQLLKGGLRLAKILNEVFQ